MRYSVSRIVFQEIPDEVSLAFYITGCPLRCPGCHSSEFWNPNKGDHLNIEVLQKQLQKLNQYITCVLYLGGEWEVDELAPQLDFIKTQGFKTALYTGLELSEVPKSLIQRLDYLKYGPYIKERGPLNSSNTNQVLINIKTHENLNDQFFRKDSSYDSTRP